MELSTKTEGPLRIVAVQDARIDAIVALKFKEAMRGLTEDGPQWVVLDLSKVQFVDSSGLGAIVAAMKNMAGERTLVLAGLTPMVDKVFRLTRMDQVFRIFGTLDAALKELRV
jgi:anti-sigma B factor antagonist